MAVYRTLGGEIPSFPASSTAPVTPPSPLLWCSLGFALRLTLILLLLFAAGITLLRALPYSPDDLLALFTSPSNCAAPCWNGIQPNITTLDEAAAVLEAGPYVADYQVTPGKLSWWWNGSQSALLDTSGSAFHGRMEYALVYGEDRVTSIVLDTNVRLGDLQAALGSPDLITLHVVQPQDASQRAGMIYLADYDAVTIFALLNCPLNVADFWQTPVYIAYGARTFDFEGQTFHSNALPDWFFRDQAPGCAAG
jgi:hypothetical protein